MQMVINRILKSKIENWLSPVILVKKRMISSNKITFLFKYIVWISVGIIEFIPYNKSKSFNIDIKWSNKIKPIVILKNGINSIPVFFVLIK